MKQLEVSLTWPGLSLEQVDELYGLVDKAWKSKDFRPQVSFREAAEKSEQDLDLRKMSVAQSERRASNVVGKEVA